MPASSSSEQEIQSQKCVLLGRDPILENNFLQAGASAPAPAKFLDSYGLVAAKNVGFIQFPPIFKVMRKGGEVWGEVSEVEEER